MVDDKVLSDQVNIQERPMCDRVIRNSYGAKFRGREPRFLLVSYVLSLSASSLQSTKANHPVYVWRADDVKLIYDDNKEISLTALRERDGREVSESIRLARRFKRTVDVDFVRLINANRPITAPEDTPGVYVGKVHLNYPAEVGGYGHDQHDAKFARLASGSIK